MSTRLLTYADLKQRGIVGSRADLHRKRQREHPRFPTPVQDGGMLKWVESEIEDYSSRLPRVAKREQASKVVANKARLAEVAA